MDRSIETRTIRINRSVRKSDGLPFDKFEQYQKQKELITTAMKEHQDTSPIVMQSPREGAHC